MIKMGCFECGNDVYCQHCGCHLGYDALVAERDALRAALEAVVDTTDGKPGALVQECRQIARTALRAIAEGEA